MMDADSSTKFIGSLTKFLQSLCNGYVEFQRGVELVGHIYLSIDTGEKVDYILHEKVSKNDENSVTFVSNSFHAQPLDKTEPPKDSSVRPAIDSRDSESDDDIMIVDQSKGTPGSTNFGTIPSRKHTNSGFDKRTDGSLHQNRSSANQLSSPQRNRQHPGKPPATATSQSSSQENINIGEVKLEQLSSDELLSLASHVDGGDSASNFSDMQGQAGGAGRIGRRAVSDTAGQPVWIKQEPGENLHGGPDTGWSQGGDGHSDSSNSSSNLYPMMMHQNPAGFPSNPVFHGFSSSSSQGFAQSRPGTSGAANPFGNPMPGTSQSMDPAVPKKTLTLNQRTGPFWSAGHPTIRNSVAEYSRRYRARIRHDPERFLHYKMKHKERNERYRQRKRLNVVSVSEQAWGGNLSMEHN